MSQGVNIDQILSETRKSIACLKDIDSFFERLDSLHSSDLKGWDYLIERMFSDERNLLFDLINVLENELLPKIEERLEEF